MSFSHDLLEDVVSRLMSAGGEYADIFYQDMTSNQLEAESGRVERVSAVRETGAGLRLIRGGVTYFASTVDLAPRHLLGLADDLAAGSGEVGGSGPIHLTKTSKGPLAPGEDPSAVAVDEKADLVLRAVRSLEGFDDRLLQVKSVYRDSSALIQIANSDGVLGEDTRRHGVGWKEFPGGL
jgi:TldD protein